MKRVLITAVALTFLFLVLPVVLVEPLETAKAAETPLLPATPSPAQPREEMTPSQDSETFVRVAMTDGTVSEMTMADYLWSVVSAEMPATFELEALKAQAVTARTYAAWKMRAGDADHPNADVCTDITCCQAFIHPEQAAANWGTASAAYTEKVRSAVADTDGMILTYEGQPIQAVFFSSAAGRTEDAVAVWGNAVPYLVGVDSPEGEDVPNYHTEVVLTVQEFRQIFLDKYPGADLSGAPSAWFGAPTLTASGRVASLPVGGLTVAGTQIRSLFSLRSTCFTVLPGEDSVTFQVTGYGHGVGMSQYGANALAGQGYSYRDILAWYYTGVELG